MGASTSQTEIVRDIRADGGSGNGQETYNSMMSQSLPTLSDLEIGDKVELVLYSVAKAAGGRRAVLHVMDASKDLHGLSSRAVTHCVWVANVPPALLGTVHAGANRACCALRNALDPSKAAQGNNGVNMKVYLCMNPSGKAVTLKSVLDEGTLASYLTARRG